MSISVNELTHEKKDDTDYAIIRHGNTIMFLNLPTKHDTPTGAENINGVLTLSSASAGLENACM